MASVTLTRHSFPRLALPPIPMTVSVSGNFSALTVDSLLPLEAQTPCLPFKCYLWFPSPLPSSLRESPHCLYSSDRCFHAKDSESVFLVLAQSWDPQLSAPNPCIPEADSSASSCFSCSYCREKLSTGQCSRFMRPSFYHRYNE